MKGLCGFDGRAAALAMAALCAVATAQRGDRKGENQAPLPEGLAVPPAPALGPQEALASLRVPPGYEVRLVAAEPLVEDPILLRFDARGRPWVVEMRGYMPNVDGEGEDAPVGRISILEDDDGDGVYDRAVRFAEELVLPRGLFLYQDGALVIEPPSVWFLRDTDGDGRADTREHVVDGFEHGVEAVEHCGNGMVWGIDGWLYLAKHPTRIRRTADGWEEEPHPFVGQWGLTRTDDGRLLYNYNSSYLHGDLFPGSYAERNPNFGRAPGCNLNLHRDQTTWPARMTPGVNRGYRKGVLREDYTLARFTATCSPEVYRGDLLADAVGDVFVCEPSGNFVRRSRLVEDGLTMAAEHVDPGGEFLTSTDERFRPVSVHHGPGGELFVVDLYRGILQHKVYVTSFLRRQILERGLDKPIGLGRIYQVVPAGHRPVPREDLAALDGAALVERLRHRNGWQRDMAQRLLVERRPNEALLPLRDLVDDVDARPGSRALGLWTLHLLERLPRGLLLRALRSGEPELVIAGLRVGEARLAAGDRLLRGWICMSHERFAPRVALQALLSASAADDVELVAELVAPRLGDKLYRGAALTGLRDREVDLARLLADRADGSGDALALMRDVGRCAARGREPAQLSELLELAASRPTLGTALLEGVAKGLPKGDKREGFLPLAVDPVALAPWLDTTRAFDERQKPFHDKLVSLWSCFHWGEPPPVPEVTPEIATRLRAGGKVYAQTCVHCHQRNGQGLSGLAPPLAGSEWVADGPEALLRVIFGGLDGPITIGDEAWDKAMESHAFLSDDQAAAVATYVRLSWDNGAHPVTPEQAAAIRAEAESRGKPYTAPDLRK